MKKVIIDLTNCASWKDIYQTIKTTLDIPPHYGENLDALWDSLTGYIEHPVHIDILGMEKLNDELQPYALQIMQVFFDAEKYMGDIYISIAH